MLAEVLTQVAVVVIAILVPVSIIVFIGRERASLERARSGELGSRRRLPR